MASHGITKVVFPVAGLGTRFLPATKSVPKEMLPVVDRPLIQYAVDEAVSAGARELIFVTGNGDSILKGHFGPARELEASLEASGKSELLASVRDILPRGVDCKYVRQSQPRGLGDAIRCARSAVGNEAFGVILPDDLIDAPAPGALSRMVDLHGETGAGVVAVENVPADRTGSYGIVSTGPFSGRAARVEALVEKPDPADAPSDLAVVGRYVLPPEIFDLLEQTGPGSGGEIQLTDAIAALIPDREILAYRFEGTRYDCGSKAGHLEATVQLALKHPELGNEFASYLRAVVKSMGSSK